MRDGNGRNWKEWQISRNISEKKIEWGESLGRNRGKNMIWWWNIGEILTKSNAIFQSNINGSCFTLHHWSFLCFLFNSFWIILFYIWLAIHPRLRKYFFHCRSRGNNTWRPVGWHPCEFICFSFFPLFYAHGNLRLSLIFGRHITSQVCA